MTILRFIFRAPAYLSYFEYSPALYHKELANVTDFSCQRAPVRDASQPWWAVWPNWRLVAPCKAREPVIHEAYQLVELLSRGLAQDISPASTSTRWQQARAAGFIDLSFYYSALLLQGRNRQVAKVQQRKKRKVGEACFHVNKDSRWR